jgi:hypothetical protein
MISILGGLLSWNETKSFQSLLFLLLYTLHYTFVFLRSLPQTFFYCAHASRCLRSDRLPHRDSCVIFPEPGAKLCARMH